MKIKILSIALAGVALGCANQQSEDGAFRVLPVAAVAEDGSEVLVGLYDEQSQELELVPEFVDRVRTLSDAPIQVSGLDELHPLEDLVTWSGQLDAGSQLALILTEDGAVRGGTLIVHDEAWTDGLTEEQAASSFAACFDPEPCWPEQNMIIDDPWCDPFPGGPIPL